MEFDQVPVAGHGHAVRKDGDGFRVHRPDGHSKWKGFTKSTQPPADKPALHLMDAAALARVLHAHDSMGAAKLAGSGFSGQGRVSALAKKAAWQLVQRAVPGVGHAATITKGMNLATKKQESVHVDHKIAAEAAKLAYAGLTPRNMLAGWIYEAGLSSDEMAVWSQPRDEGKSAVLVAFRGTKPDGSNDDLESDARLAVGAFRSSPRWKRTVKALARVDKRFDLSEGTPVMFTGHSLGGKIAMDAAALYPNAKPVAFNPGTGLDGFAKTHHRGTVYTVRGDMVSALAPLSGQHHDVHLLEPKDNGWLAKMAPDPLTAHAADQFTGSGVAEPAEPAEPEAEPTAAV